MFSDFTDVQKNTRDKNPLDIKLSSVYKKSGSEASGTIRLHRWTSNDPDTSPRQPDGLFNQTMVEHKKKNDTSFNHALHVRSKERR